MKVACLTILLKGEKKPLTGRLCQNGMIVMRETYT